MKTKGLQGSVEGTYFLTPEGLKAGRELLIKFTASLYYKEISTPSLISLTNHPKADQGEHSFVLPKNKLLAGTSEVLFCEYVKRFYQSYKEYPIHLFQTSQVYRKESNVGKSENLHRNNEFHLAEYHSFFTSYNKAIEFKKLMQDGILVLMNCEKNIKGTLRNQDDTFHGAEKTGALDLPDKNGTLVQLFTFHLLKQDYVKDIKLRFQDSDNKMKYPYYISGGFSTRLLGFIEEKKR